MKQATFILMIAFAGYATSCKKDKTNDTPAAQAPTVTTTSVSLITQTTAQSGGNVTSDGGATITQRGVCWSTNQNPTTADSKTTDGTGSGSFSSNLSSLTASTTYYVRAYATNSAGTSYGSQTTFTNSGAPAFIVGQSYGGGIIFYVSGTTGLIASTSDQSNGVEWGCLGTSLSGTNTAVNTGQANTTAIATGCATSNIAAKICDNLVLNGFSDWYLPSKDELNLMYQQRTLIGGFNSSKYYWSSSEVDANRAWRQDYDTGFQDMAGTKSFTANNVRAIRSF